MEGTGLVDAEVFRALDDVELTVPRGEPRRLVAEAAGALAARAPEADLRARLGAAAALLWDDELGARLESEEGGAASLTVALRATQAVLARNQSVAEQLAEADSLLAELDEEDRPQHAPALARVAAIALGVDVELLKDEGYRYVATYPPEGSEGVDVTGRAAAWLTRRMTVDGDGPRLAMRSFLALVAEEVEVELPIVSGLLDRLVEEPMPAAPAADRPFLSLARGLVEEALAERGPPW
jgi:hypothetical protein